MRNYEGVFIIDPDISADASKGVVSQLQEMVTKNGGRIDGLQEWGKKRLAYMIKKRREGNLHSSNKGTEQSKIQRILRSLWKRKYWSSNRRYSEKS